MLSKQVISRQCLYFNVCGKFEVYTGRWQEHWHHYKDGYLCKYHYSKLITNPKKTPEYNKKYNSRRTKEQRKKDNARITSEQHRKYNAKKIPRLLQYKDKQYVLTFEPRKGKCDWCNKKKGDQYINSRGKLSKVKKIDKHHIEYFPIFIWFGTVELCRSCHTKESERLKKIIN